MQHPRLGIWMRHLRWHHLAWVAALGLSACRTPTIRTIRHRRTEVSPTAPADHKERAQELNTIRRNGAAATFLVEGHGRCGRIRITFGDGSATEVAPADFTSRIEVRHVYAGWGGPKRVTAESVQDCVGRVSTTVSVEPPALFVGMVAGPAACAPLQGVPPVRSGSVVTIRAAGSPEPTIRFGPLLRAGIDGVSTPALGPPFAFPFPGLRAHSLVLRIVTQVVQGGNGVSFTANQSGVLEGCINDDSHHDNAGFWNFTVAVDESSVP